MSKYLELKVPLRLNTKWYDSLREALTGIKVDWKKSSYDFHITIAFIENPAEDGVVIPVLDKHLSKWTAIKLTFNKIDAFETIKYKDKVIHLTATEVPEEFLPNIDALRKDLTKAGCEGMVDFKLHVTLGKIKAGIPIGLPALIKLIDEAQINPFSLKLAAVEYKEYGGDCIKQYSLAKMR